MKRLVVVAAGFAALVFAPAAFAHTAALTGVVGCANGQANVTWLLVASDAAKNPLVVESTNAEIPVGSTPGTFVQETNLAASATVKVRWSDDFTKVVSASTPTPPECTKPPICPIPPPSIVYIDRPVDRIVYVDRVVEKIVEKVVEVPVEKIVERVVVKTKVKRVPVVKWKTKTVVQWRTRYVPCSADKNWDPITRTCTPKTPTG